MVSKAAYGWIVAGVLLGAASEAHAKQQSRLVTAEMRGNALRNAERYEWAAARRRAAVKAAERWVALSDDALWELVPSQELPRDIYNSMEHNNTLVGTDISQAAADSRFPFVVDLFAHPWKIKCPVTGQLFPKNDFGAFYKSALDEHGYFRRELGDRSLLFNPEHPDPNDPLHKVYVDDGYGMVDPQGNRYYPIGYYTQWGLWRGIYDGVAKLADAYALTSDPVYAHKAAVLLCRIADVYPEMDWGPFRKMGFRHSDGSTGRGRIEGCIWETSVATTLSRAYDIIFDGMQGRQELADFLARKSRQHKLEGRDSIAVICRHIEDNLILEFLKSIRDARIRGNVGMAHRSCLTAAIALDRPGETEQWLDFLFDPTFPGEHARRPDPIPWVLTEGLDRDGMGGEVGGYGLIWTRAMIDLAETFQRYPHYANGNLTARYPKLKQIFFIEPRLNILDSFFPNYGDSGSTGSWQRAGHATTFVRGFRLYRDARLAQLAWRYAGGKRENLRVGDSIFEADPDALGREIEALARNEPRRLTCDHLGRYGQAVIQTPFAEKGRAAFIHFGYGLGHAHRDSLTIGLLAKGVDMLPDFGYPEFADRWPKSNYWETNTACHNTLMIGDAHSVRSPGGQIRLFADAAPLRVIDVEAPRTYAGVPVYRRTLALVDVSEEDSYLLDIFRARGGSNHRLIFYGPGETAAVDGLSLVPQKTGTFAGPDVAYGQLDGERADYLRRTSFSFLYDVARSAGPVNSGFTVDWKAQDRRNRIAAGSEPHLRLHALTPSDEVATAAGDPPQNKRGNPRRLRYLLQSRLGENVRSQFVNVLEPYDRTPFIRQVRSLRVEHAAEPDTVAAVEVQLANGATDILIFCEAPTRVRVEGDIQFEGQVGLIRLRDGRVQHLRMSNATLLTCGKARLTAERGAYRGRVVAVQADDPADHRITLEPRLPQDAGLAGQMIHFLNDLPKDTSYRIQAVTAEGISTGDITILGGFKDPNNFASGNHYLVNSGDEYVVPCTTGFDG